MNAHALARTTEVASGTRVGPYCVLERVGQGGAGAVYRAVHEALGGAVAIKVLHASLAGDARMVRRFLVEARAVRATDHPGIIRIHDFGTLPDGRVYLIMEYLQGESLAARLHRQGGRLSPLTVLRLGYLVADAMAAIHAQGTVHRDLKPANIMIVPDPNLPGGERIKICDFGIARLAQTPLALRTLPSTLLGTARYMAPEQCRDSTAVDDRADVYALGVTLYLLLSGRYPIDGADPIEIIRRLLEQEPLSLRIAAPAAMPPLATLVDTLLCKDPRQRPSMREVASTLSQLLQSPSGLPSSTVRVSQVLPTVVIPQMEPTTVRPDPAPDPPVGLATWVLAVLLVVLPAGLAHIIWSSRSAAAPAAYDRPARAGSRGG